MTGRASSRVLLLLAAAAAVVCFAQAPQPIPPGSARVAAQTGQVSVLKDSIPWALQTGDDVQLQQIIVTGADGFAIFELPDGSKFEVFPNSRVTFRNNRNNWQELLDVWLGKVKVHIQKWGGQPNHNRVRTPTAVISVRGTTFHVDVEDEDATTLVVVEEGQVAVEHSLQPGAPRLLNAGEWLRVFKNQPLARQGVDRGFAIRTALRVMTDAFYSVIYGGPRVAGTTGKLPPINSPLPGGGAPLPGDTGAGTPPPPPPPAPPPPPEP